METLNEQFTQNIIFNKKSYIILLKLLTLITFIYILIKFLTCTFFI